MASRLELDWHPEKEAGKVFYEIPLNLEHLASACHLSQNLSANTISLVAEMKGGTYAPVPLAATNDLDLNNLRATILRFAPANETESLWLYFNGKPQTDNQPPPGEWNLLKRILSSESLAAWGKSSPEVGLVANPDGGGIILKSGNDIAKIPNQMKLSRILEIPDGLTGSDAVFSLDMKLKAKIPLPFTMEIRALDSNGEEIPQSVVDQRWLTFTLAPEQNINLRQAGHINLNTRKIKLTITVNVAVESVEDLGFNRPGAPLNPSEKSFQLLISRLELRAGNRILIPSYNQALFLTGISGARGDHALGLDGETCLIYNGNPSSVYTESRQPKNLKDYAWPTGSGTFETWIYPEWEKSSNSTDVCIFEVGRPASYDGGKLKIEYVPKQKTIRVLSEDFNKLPYKGEARIDIPSAHWHHLAFCWESPSGNRELFIDGKSVLRGKSYGFTGLSTNPATPKDRLMPSVCLGSSFDAIRYKNLQNNLFGRMDTVRVSTVIRYPGEFEPQNNLPEDQETCAYFDFNDCLDGRHFGDASIIPAQLRSRITPIAEDILVEDKNGTGITQRRLKWNPTEIADRHNPQRKFLLDFNIKQPESRDFDNARVTVKQKLNIKSGETRVIECTAEPYMDFVEIACPENSKPLIAPILLNAGEVDCRSYEDLADSLKLSSPSSERERADRLFNYIVDSSNWFLAMEEGLEILPSGQVDKYTHKPLSLLNTYLGGICGSQNNMTRASFIYAAGLSANMTHGNTHLFEQVFYDNQWHVYDLTQRQYFLARDHVRAASLEEIEKDLWLMERDDINYFLDGTSRGVNFSARRPVSRRKEYRLNPGEAFRYYWHNAGAFNNLQATEGAASVKWENGPKYNGKPIYLGESFPPQYANGLFVYQGKPNKSNPSFQEMTDESFCYEVNSPYVMVDAICQCESAQPDLGIKSLAISYDSGKSWNPVAPQDMPNEKGVYRLGLGVKGRYSYRIKVGGAVSRMDHFKCETLVQMNRQTLTAVLKAGSNPLQLKTPEGEAEITLQYRLNSQPIVLEGGLKFGNLPGNEKQLFQAVPGDSLTIPVQGCDGVPTVTLIPPLPFTVAEKSNQYVLSVRVPQDVSAGFHQIAIQSGKRIKQAQLVVAKNSCLLAADKAEIQNGIQRVNNDLGSGINGLVFDKRTNSCLFKTRTLPAGRYAVLSLARRVPRPDGISFVGSLNLVVGAKEVQITNPFENFAHEFGFQAAMRYRWKWDYPVTEKSSYHRLAGIDLPETSQVLIKTKTPGVILSGVLILPLEDEKIVTELINWTQNRNFNPGLFENRWEVTRSGAKY